MILVGKPQSLTTFLKKRCVVISIEHVLGVGINVACLENLSTTMRITSNSPTMGKWVMKLRETLSHSLAGTCRGSNNLTIFALSTLFCYQINKSWWIAWHRRGVLANSNLILKVHRFSTNLRDLPIEYHDIFLTTTSLSLSCGEHTGDCLWWIEDLLRPRTVMFSLLWPIGLWAEQLDLSASDP